MSKNIPISTLLTNHSKLGIALMLSNLIWWISANLETSDFKLFLGVFTFIFVLLTSCTAFRDYKSDIQKKFTEFATLNLIWMVPLTMLVENCFFNFQNPQRLMLSVIFGGIATLGLFVDIFSQPNLFRILLNAQQYCKKWTTEMAVTVALPGNILQIVALYTLIRYPFLKQLSWRDYPDQSWFLINIWHLTVTITISNLPIFSLIKLNRINKKILYLYLLSTILLSVLFCVACIHMKIKWFY